MKAESVPQVQATHPYSGKNIQLNRGEVRLSFVSYTSLQVRSLAELVWRNGRAYDSLRNLGFETRLGQLVLLLGKEISRHY